MKLDYNKTLIFYIKTLKEQNIIKNWQEGAKIYFDKEQKEITPRSLSAQAGNLLISEINPQLFFEYCKDTTIKQTETKKKSDKEETKFNLKTDTITRTLSIPEKDFKPIFGIDIENDTKEEVRKKIINKISDDVFLLEYMGFNPGRFEVQKYTTGSWTTPVKEEDENGKKIAKIILNEKFNVVIARKKNPSLYFTKKECEDWLDNFLKERAISPYDLFEGNETKTEGLDNNLMMVCPGPELHLGKLGSESDYENFSTKQAMYRLKVLSTELVEYQKKMQASQILLGVGNDFYNSDTVDDKTTAGTPQNNDTRFKEVYLWGKVGYLSMIETFKNYFDKVIIKGNPGNHDEKSSFSLFTNIYDLYNMTNDPKVEVNLTYKDMHFSTCYEFGNNLIIFSHGKSPEGKNLKDVDLARTVKNYFPEEYRRNKNVYVFAGHLHQDSETKIENVTVIRTASLSGVDSWHAANAYVGPREGHSVYLIDKEKGYIGKHNITLTDNEKKKKVNSPARGEHVDMHKSMSNALDLNQESIEKTINKSELDKVNSKISEIAQKYNKRAKAAATALNKSYNDLSKDENNALLAAIGYKEEIAPLAEKKNKIKEYQTKKENN